MWHRTPPPGTPSSEWAAALWPRLIARCLLPFPSASPAVRLSLQPWQKRPGSFGTGRRDFSCPPCRLLLAGACAAARSAPPHRRRFLFPPHPRYRGGGSIARGGGGVHAYIDLERKTTQQTQTKLNPYHSILGAGTPPGSAAAAPCRQTPPCPQELHGRSPRGYAKGRSRGE